MEGPKTVVTPGIYFLKFGTGTSLLHVVSASVRMATLAIHVGPVGTSKYVSEHVRGSVWA